MPFLGKSGTSRISFLSASRSIGVELAISFNPLRASIVSTLAPESMSAYYIKKGSNMVQKARNQSLNVKDPEAHRLAEAIARETGETLTHAVTESLRQRLERLHTQDHEALAAD